MMRSQRSAVISSGFSTTTCLPASAGGAAESIARRWRGHDHGRPRPWRSSAGRSSVRCQSAGARNLETHASTRKPHISPGSSLAAPAVSSPMSIPDPARRATRQVISEVGTARELRRLHGAAAGAGAQGRGRRDRVHAQRRAHGLRGRRRRGRQALWSSRSRWRSPPSAATASSTPARRTASSCAPSSPSRFGDANRALKAAVEAGRFGRLTLARPPASGADAGILRPRRLAGTWALDGGGALMNQAIHNVDLSCG